jgi:hypothetical protein
MKKNIFAVIIGGAIFVLIFAFWIWQFPDNVKKFTGGKDGSLSSIFSAFSQTKSSLSDDLVKARQEMETNAAKFETIFQNQMAEEQEKAAAAAAMKKKVVDETAAKLRAATAVPAAPEEKTDLKKKK